MLILASASPRRRDLLAEAGFTFEVLTADVDEDANNAPESLVALVEDNAALKAKWIAERHPGKLCIGADTLVSIDGAALGKPTDIDEAHTMVTRLSGRTHKVCTGVCLAHDHTEKLFHVVTEVTFKPLTADEIRAYHRKIEPLDKAGAYAAQDHGKEIIESINGSWSNVVGLPMETLLQELAALGITPCDKA